MKNENEAKASDIKVVTVPRHTVIVLIGPTMCGKTTFLRSGLSDEMKSECMYLSSDMLRQALLRDDTSHRHSPQMLQVSKQAFNILFSQYKASLSYPVNAPYVVIDTRGFDETFRNQIREIARENNYNTMAITFEYKNKDDYFTYVSTEAERRVVDQDVTRFRRKVLPTMRASDWGQRLRINSRDAQYLLQPIPPENYVLPLNEGSAVAVIGDSHECCEELVELVARVEEKYGTETHFVHVGDYLDKGGDTEAMLNLMKSLVETGRHHIVAGNHEAYVDRRLKGEISENAEFEEKYIQSLPVIVGNAQLQEIFEGLHSRSYYSLDIQIPGCRSMVVTHAPCPTKHLGRQDPASLRAQRNLRIDRDKSLRDQMKFLYDEAESIHPLHIFGHIAHKSDALVYKNKVFLDTGAVHGGNLTAFVMRDDRYEFISVKSRQRIEEGVDTLPDDLTIQVGASRKFNIDDYELTAQDRRLVNTVMKQGVQYISGTMPPAPSSDLGLETLDSAFDYFQKKGITQVVVQPKYMGSRCQLYLFRDPEEECFAVSRNGWVIRKIDGLPELLEDWREKVFKDNEWASVILDGELLPWRALGSGLIDRDFTPYSCLVGRELVELGTDSWFSQQRIGLDYEVTHRADLLCKYEAALENYTGDDALEFKSFDILAVNGKTVNLPSSAKFDLFNTDTQVTIDVTSLTDRFLAKQFYDSLVVDDGMEGVVVKPAMPVDGVVPYMKVRNSEYLRIVYGYDYTMKLDKLIRQKNISGKAAVAVREHRLATEMLTADDDRRLELTVKMISELSKEKEIDPRL